MAVGDAISDAYISVATGTTVDIRPAAGVEWMITTIRCNSDAAYTTIRGKDSAGNSTGDLYVGLYGGATGNQLIISRTDMSPMKLLITNSEFIAISNNTGSTVNIAYFGVQTK